MYIIHIYKQQYSWESNVTPAKVTPCKSIWVLWEGFLTLIQHPPESCFINLAL